MLTPSSTRRSHAPRRTCLYLEELESRQLLSGFQPTAAEQLFLERLNDARANPAAYGASIGVDLSSVAPSQPLAMNALLVQSARLHSLDMNNNAYFSHTGSDGSDPGQRMANAGFAWTSWGESIAAGYPTPEQALAGLIVDTGVPDLGHRRHLLAIDPIYQGQRQVGVGIVQNGSGPYANYYTIDSAASSDSRPFLTGVVFNDANGNGKYAIGEGLGGVTITVVGVGSMTTFDTGGYSFRVSPGTYTVTASGAGLSAPITSIVTVGSANYRLNFIGSPVPSDPLGGATKILVTGADAGGAPVVQVYDAVTGALKSSWLAYAADFRGGVRVAVGDVDGDGIPDIITAPGPGGGPHIKVFSGKDGSLLRTFLAYDPSFTAGVNIAAGDVNGDGFADIITGADSGGGPHVKVFSGRTGELLYSFMAYDASFRGGVRVASGDVNGDGYADIITGAGPGGGPHVKVFSGRNGALLRSFMAYSADFRGGVYVAAGDTSGHGRADIITGAGAGGGPHVEVFSGYDGSVLQNFMAYDPRFSGGVRVACVELSGGSQAAIITGAGPSGGPSVRILDALTLADLDTFFAYDPGFHGGVFVAGGNQA